MAKLYFPNYIDAYFASILCILSIAVISLIDRDPRLWMHAQVLDKPIHDIYTQQIQKIHTVVQKDLDLNSAWEYFNLFNTLWKNAFL